MSCTVQIFTARAAMARAAWVRGVAPYYDKEAVIDLLADLRHWCAQAGIDYTQCDHTAWTVYNNESGSAS